MNVMIVACQNKGGPIQSPCHKEMKSKIMPIVAEVAHKALIQFSKISWMTKCGYEFCVPSITHLYNKTGNIQKHTYTLKYICSFITFFFSCSCVFFVQVRMKNLRFFYFNADAQADHTCFLLRFFSCHQIHDDPWIVMPHVYNPF